ncbi:MAG: hypothetical protein ACI4NV_06885 [Thermoguttaceae bacterium]
MEEREEYDNRESSVWGYLFELLVLLVCAIVLGCGFGIAFCLTICQYVNATIVVKTDAKDSGFALEHRVIESSMEEESQNDALEYEEPLPEIAPTAPETPEELDELTALHMLGIDVDEKVPVPYEKKKDSVVRLIPHSGVSLLNDNGNGKTKNLK